MNSISSFFFLFLFIFNEEFLEQPTNRLASDLSLFGEQRFVRRKKDVLKYYN